VTRVLLKEDTNELGVQALGGSCATHRRLFSAVENCPVGLTISIPVPAFVHEKDTVDPQTTQEDLAIGKAFHEANNKNDAARLKRRNIRQELRRRVR
jgi:hypothetical protein